MAGLLLGAGAAAIPSSAQYGPYPSTPSAPSSPNSSAGSHSTKGKHHTGKKGKKHKTKKKKSTGSTVKITGQNPSSYSFSPKKVTINKGGTVHWSWSSNAPHNVTFQSLNKHSATGSSGSFQLKFATSGTFQYHCTIHGFTGTVVVK